MGDPHDHSHGAWHTHGAGDGLLHERSPSVVRKSARTLLMALALTGGFMVAEIIASVVSGSLALASDAAHMATDALSLALAWGAAWLALKPPSDRFSYGLARAESLAAFVNGLTLLIVAAWIIKEAAHRLSDPHAVAGNIVTIVAIAGLAINLLVAWVLSRDRGNVNVRAALAHVLGDALGSVAALIAGLSIQLKGWLWMDPLLSVLVALLVAWSAISILRTSGRMLLDATPADVSLAELSHDLRALPGVLAVHDLHAWEAAPAHRALSAHLIVSDISHWPGILETARTHLRNVYGFQQITLQPELPGTEHAVRASTR